MTQQRSCHETFYFEVYRMWCMFHGWLDTNGCRSAPNRQEEQGGIRARSQRGGGSGLRESASPRTRRDIGGGGEGVGGGGVLLSVWLRRTSLHGDTQWHLQRAKGGRLLIKSTGETETEVTVEQLCRSLCVRVTCCCCRTGGVHIASMLGFVRYRWQ